MSQEDEQSRKRGAARQLTDRDEVDDTVGDDNGTWKKADAATMATRKIVKVRGGSKSNLERSGSDVTSPPTTTSPPSASSPDAPAPTKTSFFNFASTPAGAPATAPAAAKEETPEKKEEKDVTNGTPTKAPTTPTKEASSTTTTPAKESSSATTTPAKETPAEGASSTTTPAKEATPSTPAKEGTPAKDANTTPAKEGDAPKTETPEPPKFSLPTSFSFPTSFSQTTPFSFPTLSNPGLPAFPASNSTGFTGFSFPTVNFSANASVFSAAGTKKEGSDDEGGDDASYNPEAEVAVDTAPSKLPVVPTVTGEEDETTIQTKRAKLYAMIEGKWQERGVGNVKLNQAKDGKCRLVMRDEKGKHLRLNTALFAEMKVEKQGDKSVQFVAVGNGGGDVPGPVKAFTTFALRVGRKEDAEELFEAIQKHKATGVDNAST